MQVVSNSNNKMMVKNEAVRDCIFQNSKAHTRINAYSGILRVANTIIRSGEYVCIRLYIAMELYDAQAQWHS